MLRLIVRSIVAPHDLSYHWSSGATIDCALGRRMHLTIGRRIQRLIDRTIGRRPSRLIVLRSLIATTSRTISYDGSCHRYNNLQSFVMARPRVEIDRGMRPLLEIVANIADRSHLDAIATNRTIQKSYDPV